MGSRSVAHHWFGELGPLRGHEVVGTWRGAVSATARWGSVADSGSLSE